MVAVAVLLPCRDALNGAFPLAGTYFQTNEVFLDDFTLTSPIVVPLRPRASLALHCRDRRPPAI